MSQTQTLLPRGPINGNGSGGGGYPGGGVTPSSAPSQPGGALQHYGGGSGQVMSNGVQQQQQQLQQQQQQQQQQQEEEQEEEREESPPEIDITINNVVCSFSVRCHLNLRDIALRGINVEYRKENGVRTQKIWFRKSRSSNALRYKTGIETVIGFLLNLYIKSPTPSLITHQTN